MTLLLRAYSADGGLPRARTRLAADLLVLAGMAVLFFLLIRLSHGVNSPFNRVSAPSSVSTDPANLPYYAARSLLRMFAALAVSLVFTLIYATAAARSGGRRRSCCRSSMCCSPFRCSGSCR